MATTWITADPKRRATSCSGCHRAIEFATNVKTGKAMPFDAPIVPIRTRWDLETRAGEEEVDLSTSHFVTCPKADTFRRPR